MNICNEYNKCSQEEDCSYGNHEQNNYKGKSEIVTGRNICNIPRMYNSGSTNKIYFKPVWNASMGISSDTETDKGSSIRVSCKSETEREKENNGPDGRFASSIQGTISNKRCISHSGIRVILTKKKDELGLKGNLTGYYPKEIKKQVVSIIQEVINCDVQQNKACQIFGIVPRKFRRWRKEKDSGGRIAWNKLAQQEQKAIINAAYEPELLGKPISHIYVWGNENKHFYASMSSVYNVLSKANLVKPVEKRRNRQTYVSIHELMDAGFSILCYDGTEFKTESGLIVWGVPVLLLPSRYVLNVGYAIGSLSAVDLVRIVQESIENIPERIWKILLAHSDRGSAMKAKRTKKSIEDDLGIPIHFGRPHTPEDQAWIEALIKTLKYHRETPSSFIQVADIVGWFKKFPGIYNNEPHSSLKYVTPAQALAGKMEVILKQRKNNLLEARKRRLALYYASKKSTIEK